jgi:15-cis-phytoene synthase
MTFAPQVISASYEACRRLSRQAKSSFRASFLLLPPAKRRAMEALYAFMRHSDDLVDEPPGNCPPATALAAWRQALQAAIDGQVMLGDEVGDGSVLLPALADTIAQFQIPLEHLLAVLDGMAMDLQPRAYATFAELELYCERVASAVGLACIHIWGFHGPQAIDCARSAGIALQLTNILRDLREDVQRGRVYLPADDLAAAGYSSEDLRRATIGPAFYRLMETEIQRTAQYYRASHGLLDCLEPDGRRIFAMIMATYHALLHRIRRRPADVLFRQVRIAWPQRLWIAARGTMGDPRRLLGSRS